MKQYIQLKAAPGKKEKGQSMAELAISITMLFIILAGTVDIGRLYFHYVAMRDSAQEAASYGAVFPTHCDQIRDRAWMAMDYSGAVEVTVMIEGRTGGLPGGAAFSDNCIDAAANTQKSCHNNAIRVTVRDDGFPITMPFLGTFLGRQTIPLSTSITDTILRPPCH